MGRTKLIETPEKMLELFQAYAIDVKDNPRQKQIHGGKDGTIILERPLTMVGFEGYVFKQGLNGDLSAYFANRDDRYNDYVPICTRVRNMIREDQIEGGMVGQYNASITQRLNNLAENVNNNHNVEQPLFDEIPEDDSNK